MTRNDAAKQTFAHYLSGTHWDREWYRPFQDYRVVLVELIDALLDLMENNPDFRYFHLDGQTCMLRDYVQVRPENEGRLRELIRSSRLLIGPWFTMPDLFCVGGEALVRNLLMGRRVCSEWGAEPMDVGFVCDMFGHPSQMPQLFAGFGYDRCVLGRGTNEHNTPMYFRWQGPDGSDEGFNTQEVKAFHLEDESGRRVPYQRLGLTVRANERSRYALPCFSSAGPFDRYTVAAEVAWEGMGFTSLRVVPSDKPVRAVGSLRTGPAAAENEHLAIEIAPGGTLTLTDKATGQTYNRLLQVDSRSEIGDGWFHGHGINDEQHLAVAGPEGVSVVHEGPELVTLRTTLALRVPKRYDYGHERPSEERTDVRVSHSVTLRRGAQAVEVETVIDNTAEDHRLQLLMPTDVEADSYLAHHPFDFVERSIAVDPQTADWQEMEQVEKPFLGMQSVGAGDRGLCFVSGGGLHEGGVRDDARRTMQVTLLRSFRRTVGTGGEPDGLEQGEVRLRYALMPYGGRLPRVAALRAWDRLRCGTFTRQSGQRASGFPPLDGDASAARHFLRVEAGDAIVTATKPAESGGSMVVRVWNPTDAPTDAVLWCGGKVERADRLDLAERADTTAPTPTWENYCVTVRVAPSRIATVAITLQGGGGQGNRH